MVLTLAMEVMGSQLMQDVLTDVDGVLLCWCLRFLAPSLVDDSRLVLLHPCWYQRVHHTPKESSIRILLLLHGVRQIVYQLRKVFNLRPCILNCVFRPVLFDIWVCHVIRIQIQLIFSE